MQISSILTQLLSVFLSTVLSTLLLICTDTQLVYSENTQCKKNILICRTQIQESKQKLQRIQNHAQQAKQKAQHIQRQLKNDLLKTHMTLAYKPLKIDSLQQIPSQMKIPKGKARFLSDQSAKVQKKSLRKYIKGKVSLFAFWATWCKPCVSTEEQQFLRQLQDRLIPYHIPLISVGVDAWKKLNSKRAHWYYPLWHWEDLHFQSVPKRIMQKVGLGLPLFILRNPNGSVEWIHTKILDQRVVDELVMASLHSKLTHP
jgi:thiol-disulfide isomerase/thioredoxin